MAEKTEGAIRLRVEEPCGNCNGVGVVHDPENFGYAESAHLRDEEWVKFLHDKGMSESDPLPPEEGDCPDCEGEGWTGKLITLRELSDLFAEVQK